MYLYDKNVDISKINKKETPEEKIELMKSVMDVYRLVVKDTEGGKEYKAKQHSEKVSNLEMLIFRAIVIAEPPNFITNLAYVFTHYIASSKCSCTRTNYYQSKARSLTSTRKSLNTFTKTTFNTT